jgi:hypothetical protein
MTVDWFRGIVAPVIVAVLVGLASGYLASRTAIATHNERIAMQGQRIERVEARVNDLQTMQISITRLEVQMAQVMLELQRLNSRLEVIPR